VLVWASCTPVEVKPPVFGRPFSGRVSHLHTGIKFECPLLGVCGSLPMSAKSTVEAHFVMLT